LPWGTSEEIQAAAPVGAMPEQVSVNMRPEMIAGFPKLIALVATDERPNMMFAKTLPVMHPRLKRRRMAAHCSQFNGRT
jgi:hypothetical protein